jgi:DNA excision repair protein ERCC-4
MTREILPVITCDTREPKNGGWEPLFTVPTVRAKLDTGDYSLLGAEHLISIERKSLPDLLGSLTHDRARFERELMRGKALDFFAVIVEASATEVLAGRYGVYGRGCNPKSIWESCCCFSVRYAPFLFASDRITAAKLCESLLMKWAREHQKIVDGIESASRGRQAERAAG